MRKTALFLVICLLVQCFGIPVAFGDGETIVLPETTGYVEAAEAVTEEPVKEEAAPAADEPAKEEAVPAAEEPVKEEAAPAAEEPAKEEAAPAAEEPAKEEAAPAADEPAKEEAASAADEPAKEEAAPAADEPAKEDEEPAAEEPASDEPAQEAETPAEDKTVEDQDIFLASIFETAVIYEDEKTETAALELTQRAVVLVLEEKESCSRISYVLRNQDGSLEVKEGYAKNDDLSAFTAEETEAWQALSHAVSKSVQGYDLEPVSVFEGQPVPSGENADEIITDPDPELGLAAEELAAPEGAENADDLLGADEWDEVADVLGTETGSSEFAVDFNQHLIQYNGTDTIVQIPVYVMYNGSPVEVKGIENSAFAGNTAITKIIIPTTVTWIDTGAFKGCTALESINIPDNVTNIAVGAFENCTSLKSISWSDSVSAIMDRAFYNCTSLQTLGSSSNVTKIGDYAFYGCSSLTAITWSNKLTTIGKYSYANCTGLSGLSFPQDLDTVDDFAFSGCTNILKVEFQGAKLKNINTGAFRDCTSLKAIYIPDSVETLGNSAFENCTSATVLSLSTKLQIIQDFTFKNCSALTTLSIPDGVKDIHREAFYGCSNVEYVYTIPSSVGFIGNYAFYGLKNRCVIVVENGAAVIGIDALGMDSILFSWLGSTTQAYANAHSDVRFYDMQIVKYVDRCYNKILGRKGDPGGMVYWSLNLAEKRKSGGDIVHDFMFSQEFANLGKSNAEAVEILYEAMQGRASDPSGKAYWLSALELGCSYDFVIHGFCSSPEFHGICDSYGINPGYITLSEYRDMNIQVTAFVWRCYKKIQNREPDAGGLNYWCGRLLRREMTGAAVVAEFLASAEFKNRGLSDADQVEILYETMMDRASDATGKAYWLSFLSQNMTMEYIVKGFADSVEFRFLCANYGIVPGPFTPHEYRDWNERVTEYVSRLYQQALNRTTPDTYGLNSMTGRLLTKRAKPLAIAVEMFTSLECQLQWFSNSEFVDRVYEGMLGRTPSATELANGTLVLNQGMPRRDFVIYIGGTVEFLTYAASLGL